MWNGPTPRTSTHRRAAGNRSSTTKPSWNIRYSPSGHGWPNSLWRRGSAIGTDEHLLGGAGHQVTVDVVDGAANQAAVSRHRQQFRGVAVPPVELHRPVQPYRVVEAERGRRLDADRFRVPAQRDVE